MKLSLRSLLAPSLALSLCFSAPLASAQSEEDVRNWQMFAHFVNVARPAQAKPFGERLLEMSNADFLAAIEADRLHPFEEVAEWGVDGDLKPIWEAIQDKRQAALTERSRDADQIRADIKALGKGRTAEYLAINRLKTTGQFATPYFLEVLKDDSQSKLHPRVINAMVEVGSELTYPLSIALPNLDPTTQVMVCSVIGEIGYPEALPYLKHMSDTATNTRVKSACLAAFNKVVEASGVDASGSAADLFIRVGLAKYNAGTDNSEILGMDLANKKGIVWRYNKSAGLVPIPVEQVIYADSLAMQNAESALKLDPEMASAVTLHLASNLRRENRLDGAPDPGYTLPHPAGFYLLVSGAPQQKAVLNQGLIDGDTALALDAITAMANTVGDNVLLGSEEALPVEVHNPPKQVKTTVNIIWKGRRLMTPLGGGVQIIPTKALDSGVLQRDEDGKVAAQRDAIKVDSLPAGQWWWD